MKFIHGNRLTFGVIDLRMVTVTVFVTRTDRERFLAAARACLADDGADPSALLVAFETRAGLLPKTARAVLSVEREATL